MLGSRASGGSGTRASSLGAGPEVRGQGLGYWGSRASGGLGPGAQVLGTRVSDVGEQSLRCWGSRASVVEGAGPGVVWGLGVWELVSRASGGSEIRASGLTAWRQSVAGAGHQIIWPSTPQSNLSVDHHGLVEGSA